ncbi:MAG: NAD(P)/FAD-dependent oxidoreductase [Chloroflexota bacterium]
MKSYQYLIVGGGIAGGRAIDGIRKLDQKGTVALVTRDAHPPYQKPPLSKGYLVGTEGLDQLYLKDVVYYEQNQVDLFIGSAAIHLDRVAHTVTLNNGEAISYKKLLLATGAIPFRLPLPGADLERVWTLRTIEDSDSLRNAAKGGGPAVVLGGSFIGAEVAAALSSIGMDVTMVFPESRLLARVCPPELSAFIAERFVSQGIRLLSGQRPERLVGTGQVERVILDNGDALPANQVVMGVGVRPDTALAKEAGLELDEKGGVVVDEHLTTSDPDIYAAGDIAAWPDPTSGRRIRVEHWDVARQQGIRAGRNMAGEGKPYGAVPYFYSDLLGYSLEGWGDLTGWDAMVRRGRVGDAQFSFYSFKEGKLAGVLFVNPSNADRKTLAALVKAKPNQSDVATDLADETKELGSLLAPETER